MSEPGRERRASLGERARAWAARWPRDESASLVALTVAVGIMGGLVTGGFHALSVLLARLLFPGAHEGLVAGFLASPWWVRLAIPTVGGLVAGCIRWYLIPEGKIRGFPEILEAVTMGSGVLRVRRAFPTGMSSLATYASGGSVGREGAIIQISAALASWLGRKLKLERPRLKTLVGCGVAAGMSSAYRTPIAGALFSLEVLYGRFAFDELGLIVVASVAGTFTAYTLVGRTPIYDVSEFTLGGAHQFIPYIVIGLLAGPAAVLFQRCLDLADRGFRRVPLPMPIKAAVGGLGVGAIAIAIPEVTGNGYEPLREVLGGHPALSVMALLFVGKIVATSLTVGSGGMGGVFTPTLLVGATLGGTVGSLVQGRFPDLGVDTGACAMIGMGSLLSATTRAPIMAILMVFETTQQYALILPLMLASVMAYAGARMLQRDSVYIAELRRRGIEIEGQREVDILSRLSVREILRANVPLVPQTMPLDTLLRVFRDTRELFLYVGDEEGRLRGVIDLHDIKDFLGGSGFGTLILAADLIRPVPPICVDDRLIEADHRLRLREVGQVPVVDTEEGGRYLGVVTRKDLLAALERAIVIEGRGEAERAEEEPQRARLEYVDVPEALVGRQLDAIEEELLPGLVLGVRRAAVGGHLGLLPPHGLDLRRGDVLVVVPAARFAPTSI